MTLFAWIWANIVPFLFVLTIVVFFHELGHFLVARWCGVAVKVFSVGFGPELAGFTDRSGTRWRLSAIPLGGYVKFLGDDSVASTPDREAAETMSPEERRRSFAAQSVGARAAIVAAGPIANFLLAILIFTAIFSVFGRESLTPRRRCGGGRSAADIAGLSRAISCFDRRPRSGDVHRPAAYRHGPRRRAAGCGGPAGQRGGPPQCHA